MRTWIKSVERRLGGKLVAHKLALEEPEEDEFLLLHIWSTIAINHFSAIMEAAAAHTRFDLALPRTDRQRITAFYKQCVQRHAYAHGLSDGSHYLAKSPAFSPKVEALWSAFPDAKLIYLVRNPLDVIPSYTSLLDIQWTLLAAPLEKWGSARLCARYGTPLVHLPT